MTFDDILNKVITLLKRQGRVSYRAIKVRFNLNDDHLEAVKDELIYAQQLAVDENDRVLVWTGETEDTSVPVSQRTQPAEQPIIQESQSTQPPPEPTTPDAERRQLTVMFCDLADSTRLSGQLDPEDLRDVIRAYQTTCGEVIERYDGYIAQHLGDGLMVYFGWPQAHEDDAQRAVHAGLGILEAMRGLNARLEKEKSIRLSVRIGIHTGLVVVGEIGQGASQEHLALGETPNIASRIEGIGAPDTVAISDTTYQLVRGYFVCEDLGQHMLRGVDESQHVYQAVKESDAQSRLDVAASRGLTPLVGRESETAMLFERWEQVKAGQGQVVLLSGEAGIGKSRLLQVLRDHVADEPHTRLECRSSPYYQNTALYPITDMFQRVLNWDRNDTPEVKLDKLEQTLRAYRLELDEAIPLFANLLSLTIREERYPPLNQSPQQQRQRTLETIVRMLVQQAEEQPVLFILEDLHWTDPSTLELLDLLLDQTPTAAFCVLLTCRPTFQPSWGSRSYLTPIALNRLSRSQIESMAERVAGGKCLPAEVMKQIIEKTDGVPLFVEEMTKAVVESGTLKEVNGQYELVGSLASLSIPTTLQDSLMARLDRLATAKGVAQYAAVIGRQFSYELLYSVSRLNERTLQDELRRLVEAELLYQRGLPPQATYTFKHALIQDTAYQSLLKSTRHQYHQRTAQVLEEQFPVTADTQPELLAHHYTESGFTERAIEFWQQAGQNSVGRLAYLEASFNLTKAIELLTILPETLERCQQELELRVQLSSVLAVSHGLASQELGHNCARARELCHQLPDAPKLFQILKGLRRYYVNRQEIRVAKELGEQLLQCAEGVKEEIFRDEAHLVIAVNEFWLGNFSNACAHLKQVTAFYRSVQQQWQLSNDPASNEILNLAGPAWVLMSVIGYPDQALQRGYEALHHATKLAHPYRLIHTQFWVSIIHQYRGEFQLWRELAESCMHLAMEHGFIGYIDHAIMQYCVACAAQGYGEEYIVRLKEALVRRRTRGERLNTTYYLALLARAYQTTGQIDEGIVTVMEALQIVDDTSERAYEAEFYRLKGELLLQQAADNATEANACFHQALDIARRQQAKSLELRAATSLARLWQSQGKRQEAYDLLAPVYEWFTEGFDTADLKDARALLAELE